MSTRVVVSLAAVFGMLRLQTSQKNNCGGDYHCGDWGEGVKQKFSLSRVWTFGHISMTELTLRTIHALVGRTLSYKINHRKLSSQGTFCLSLLEVGSREGWCELLWRYCKQHNQQLSVLFQMSRISSHHFS